MARRASQFCTLCNKATRKPKHHLRREHLPFFLFPHTACWTCFSQLSHWPLLKFHMDQAHPEGLGFYQPGSSMEPDWTLRLGNFLFWLATLLGLVSPSSLFLLVDAMPFHAGEATDSDALREDARVFCRSTANWDKLTEAQYAKLLSWRTLEYLLGLLPPAKRSKEVLNPPEIFLGLPGSVAYGGPTTLAVDAHFHLDKLLARSQNPSFQSVLDAHPAAYLLSSAVANFCYPEGWYKMSGIDDERIFFAVGFHPRRVDADSGYPDLLARLRQLLSHQRAVAVGEVGLDYSDSTTPRNAARQRQLFRQLLQLAFSLKKPVVIHCRDHGRSTLGAEQDCLAICREQLPRLFPIHRHCFTGDLADMERWRASFPNSVFGFCATICRGNYPSLAAHLPLSATVLETDSPYLPPRGSPVSTPHHLGPSAELIATAGGYSTQEVFRQTAATAARFYRLDLPTSLQ